MNLLPKHGTDFASKDYWKDFFDKRKDPFEWYGTYWDLAYLFKKYVKQSDEILMVGCGNSELSEELYVSIYIHVYSVFIERLTCIFYNRTNKDVG